MYRERKEISLRCELDSQGKLFYGQSTSPALHSKAIVTNVPGEMPSNGRWGHFRTPLFRFYRESPSWSVDVQTELIKSTLINIVSGLRKTSV